MSNAADDNEGGHVSELTKAATRLANAIAKGDAEELRLAASDHAAALGSQSTAMASSIATMLIAHMDKALHPIVERLDRADTKSLDWRSDLRVHIDNRFDRYGKELDELQGGLARLQKSAIAIDEMRVVQETHTKAIADLQQLGRDDTAAAILKLEQRLTRSELEHKELVKQYQEEHTALLLRLEQRHDF